jgi:two-component system chemotaxis response regulator CheB
VSATQHSGPWSRFDVVVIGASQGGLPICRVIAARLPADFPAAVVYVQHRSPDTDSVVTELMSRHSRLPVALAQDGAAVVPGTLWIAPHDTQLVIGADRRFRAERDGDWPMRCLADPLLGSVAGVYRDRAIAVVLTGRLDDGAAGARLVKAAGGRVLVQDPATADWASMPESVLVTGCFDFVLDAHHIADALVALVSVPGAAELFEVRPHPWYTAGHAG